MSRVLNNVFDDWSASPKVNLATDVEAADDWYAGPSQSGQRVYARRTDDFPGNTCIRLGSGDGAASEIEVYQDIAITAGQVGEATFTCDALTTTDATAYISLDDGTTVYTSSVLGVNTTGTLSISGDIDPTATSLRILVHITASGMGGSNTGSFTNTELDYLYVQGEDDPLTVTEDASFTTLQETADDEVTLQDNVTLVFNRPLVLTTSDSLSFSDVLDIDVTGKSNSDSVFMQDWVRIRKVRPQDNWS